MEYKVDDTGLQAAVFLPFVSLHNRKRKRIKDVASMQYTMTKASRPCPAALLTLTSVWSVAADRGCIAHYAPCTDQSKLLFRTTEGSGHTDRHRWAAIFSHTAEPYLAAGCTNFRMCL